MLSKLIPALILLGAALVLWLAYRSSRQKADTLLTQAGLAPFPPGPRLRLKGVFHSTRIMDGVFVAVGTEKNKRNVKKYSPIGTYRPHEGAQNQINQFLILHPVHLWIIYPQPYPDTFVLDIVPGKNPAFTGDYSDMAELLGKDAVTKQMASMRTALAPLGGTLRMDHTSLDITLPEGTPITPALVETAMELWRAVRDESKYPYRA